MRAVLRVFEAFGQFGDESEFSQRADFRAFRVHGAKLPRQKWLSLDLRLVRHAFCNPFPFCLWSLRRTPCGQTSVGLRIDHKAGQAEFDNEGPWITPARGKVYIDRLEYYMSMFTLVHDGGQETAIEEAYVLADGFTDGLHALESVEGVKNVEA